MYLSEINSNQTNKTEQKIVTHKSTRYKVETQYGWKPPTAIRLYLPLIKNFFLQCIGAVLYQYACYNLQRATTLSSFPASPENELQTP